MRNVLKMVALLLLGLTGCQSSPSDQSEKLVIYAGRSKELVDGIIERFEKESGIDVQVKYGKTAELALLLEQEGAQSPADLFWSQDAGALGTAAKAGLFTDLPASITNKVDAVFRNPHAGWVALTGRARTLAYSTQRVQAASLPKSVLELTDPKWKGKIAWSPENASYQAFVTAMRKQKGEQATESWLLAMKANEPKAYPNNQSIIEAIAAGEADLGLPNHYYLLGFQDKDPNYPVNQTFFAAGDLGNLVNVSGAGILKSAKNKTAAEAFLNFILSEAGQVYMANDEFEYPVVPGIKLHEGLADFATLGQLRPQVDLNALGDLEATLALLKKTGLL